MMKGSIWILTHESLTREHTLSQCKYEVYKTRESATRAFWEWVHTYNSVCNGLDPNSKSSWRTNDTEYYITFTSDIRDFNYKLELIRVDI